VNTFPLASIVVATYNGVNYLTTQLDSLLNQTYKNIEIIICDDDSTDSTLLILENFAAQHPSIVTLHKNIQNLKSVKNFEKAISLATGDYIFLCDQDDIWDYHKVDKCIKYFQENENIECIFTNAALINEEDKPIKNYNLWACYLFNPAMVKHYGGFWQMFQFFDNVATGATMAFKKQLKDLAIPFPISPGFHHDEWLALIAAYRNSLACLNQNLTQYRIHNSQVVGSDLIHRYETEQEYVNMVLELKTPYNFKLHFKEFNRLHVLYTKRKALVKNANNNIIPLEELEESSLLELLAKQKLLAKKYPFRFFLKRFKDKLKNRRQF
jgi:glycosyltransferase involved in cell wall biosynthesis